MDPKPFEENPQPQVIPIPDPTNWFELAASLCAEGKITETRFRRAVEAVQKGVQRE